MSDWCTCAMCDGIQSVGEGGYVVALKSYDLEDLEDDHGTGFAEYLLNRLATPLNYSEGLGQIINPTVCFSCLDEEVAEFEHERKQECQTNQISE